MDQPSKKFYLLIQNISMRNFHLTDSRWPNEYDLSLWTWPKNSQRGMLTWWKWLKHIDRVRLNNQLAKILQVLIPFIFYPFTYTVNGTRTVYIYLFYMFLSHVQRLMLVGVNFWSCSNVKVCGCEILLVIF